MSEPASPYIRRHSERKEEVGKGERAPILVFLSLDLVSEGFSCMTCYIPQIGGGGRVNDGNIEYKRLILASRVAVDGCSRVHCYAHSAKGLICHFCPLALSRKAIYLQRRTGLCSCEGGESSIPSWCRI